MKTSKFTDSQIMSILKQAESGTPVAALCREHGMSSCAAVLLTIYKWRANWRYGYIIDGTAERAGSKKYQT